MLKVTSVKNHLKSVFSDTKFYVGIINRKEDKCVGVYPRGASLKNIAIGGLNNTSVWYLPITLLVHWTDNSEQCEIKAQELYEYFLNNNDVTIDGRRIIDFNLLDSGPIDMSRDEKNICEMVIRMNIAYER